MKNKKVTFPIKGHLFPRIDNYYCPMCENDLSQGQVILMLENADISNHFHEKKVFNGFAITEGQCNLHFCSTQCLRDFLLQIPDQLDLQTKSS